MKLSQIEKIYDRELAKLENVVTPLLKARTTELIISLKHILPIKKLIINMGVFALIGPDVEVFDNEDQEALDGWKVDMNDAFDYLLEPNAYLHYIKGVTKEDLTNAKKLKELLDYVIDPHIKVSTFDIDFE